MQPVREMARLAHRHGALISVDDAQGAASLPFALWTGNPEDSVDFSALSGHKIYGPEGSGALVGRKKFLNGKPPMPGVGTVRGVTREVCYYDEFPANAEAGSQNHAGQIGMAVAMEVLMQIGLEKIQAEELARARYALQRLKQVEGMKILGETDFDKANRLGVIAFNLYDGEGVPNPAALVGAILAWCFAIGIRTGCFCAGPYMQELQHIPVGEANAFAEKVHTRQDRDVPYFCRASFSIDKDFQDIDILVEALKKIKEGIRFYRARFEFDEETGTYRPKGKKDSPLSIFNAFRRFEVLKK
jgi:selenocysteine lyase/cysteine desulfurase